MSLSNVIEKRYEEYKRYENILMDYDEILLFYPNYYKTKVELEQFKFISKEEAEQYFENNYKSSNLYKKLNNLAMAEDEIYTFMKHNMEFKYEKLKLLFKKSASSVIELCKLVDYIGNYPSTWPVPTEEEKNPKMEELLEKYDIMIRYYLGDDLDKMQVTSDDVVRVIEKLKNNLKCVNALIKITSNNHWLLVRKGSEETREEIINQIINDIDSFPLSSYQKRGESKREEGKMYLRLQHGNNVI